VENEHSNRRLESVFSHRVRAGKRRTYFFDVRKTKGEDFYITLTESTKRFNGEGYERHKIFLYKEDFNRFADGLKETIDHVKTELMPEYDYDEYTRRNQEWEEKRAQEAEEAKKAEEAEKLGDSPVEDTSIETEQSSAEEGTEAEKSTEAEDDLETPIEGSKDQPSPAVETEDDMEW